MRVDALKTDCRLVGRHLSRLASVRQGSLAPWRAPGRCRLLLAAATSAGPEDYEGPDLKAPEAPGADKVRTVASDWRAFRAALVAQEAAAGAAGAASQQLGKLNAADGWAHPIALPERGCLLLARQPDMGPHFTNSVIFMLEHDERGSAGLVLNFPIGVKLRDVGLQDVMAGGFRQHALYCGGPVCNSHLHVLHGCDIMDAHQVLDGVYFGGLEHANALVQAGQVDAQDFKLIAGYAGWAGGQLELEVKEGCWWLVAAAPAVILAAVRGGLGQLDGLDERCGMWQDVMQRAGLAGPFSDF